MTEWTDERFDPARVEISKEDLDERVARVRAFIRSGDSICAFALPDLRGSAFTWDPKGKQEISLEEAGYEEIMTTKTQHDCAYYGFFKPSIAEVLAQLPDDPRITAFYLDTHDVKILHDGQGHLATAHWLAGPALTPEMAIAMPVEPVRVIPPLDEDMTAFLSDVTGVVEATSFEQHVLWKENRERNKPRAWDDRGRSGYMPAVGKVGDSTVRISIFKVPIDDQMILFYHDVSSIVDHEQIRQWLDDYLPASAHEDGDKNLRLNHHDAQNFSNVFPYRVAVEEVA